MPPAPPNPSSSSQPIRTPKTKRGKRALEARAPKVIENPKRTLILHGSKCSAVLKALLHDLNRINPMQSKRYTRQNPDVQPFDSGGQVRLEFHCRKHDCSLFLLGSHLKKRPHNLTIGRLFDHRLCDVVELGLISHTELHSFPEASSVHHSTRPAMCFAGHQFETSPFHKSLKSILLDYFNGAQVKQVDLTSLDRVVFVVATSDLRIQLTQYKVKLKKSGSKIPIVELHEIGPRAEFETRRYQLGPVDLVKESMKKPKLDKKRKNVTDDEFKGKVGRVYVPQQDTKAIQQKPMKGVKRQKTK